MLDMESDLLSFVGFSGMPNLNFLPGGALERFEMQRYKLNKYELNCD